MPTVETARTYRFGRLRLVDRADYLTGLADGANVLHVGCVDQNATPDTLRDPDWVHGRIARASARAIGLDNDPAGVELLRRGGFECILGDAEELGGIELPFSPGFVLAPELIEHLPNPGRFLRGAATLMRKHTGCRLVLTTPNSMRWSNFMRAALGREVVNETHTCWYSLATLAQLLRMCDLRVEESLMYGIGGASASRRLLARIVLGRMPLLATGIVVIAGPAGSQSASGTPRAHPQSGPT